MWEGEKKANRTKGGKFAEGTREDSGKESTGTVRKPLRGQERAWRADFLRQLGQLGTNLSRGSGWRDRRVCLDAFYDPYFWQITTLNPVLIFRPVGAARFREAERQYRA